MRFSFFLEYWNYPPHSFAFASSVYELSSYHHYRLRYWRHRLSALPLSIFRISLHHERNASCPIQSIREIRLSYPVIALTSLPLATPGSYATIN
jgi:hypothetical protein